jgi:hypothetical protein
MIRFTKTKHEINANASEAIRKGNRPASIRKVPTHCFRVNIRSYPSAVCRLLCKQLHGMCMEPTYHDNDMNIPLAFRVEYFQWQSEWMILNQSALYTNTAELTGRKQLVCAVPISILCAMDNSKSIE